MDGWTATAVDLVVGPNRESVAGWRFGALFMDFRPTKKGIDFPFCWMVSHVPSGLGMVGLMTDFLQAKPAVADLASRFDWETYDPSGAPPIAAPPVLDRWVAELPYGYVSNAATIGPYARLPARTKLRLVD